MNALKKFNYNYFLKTLNIKKYFLIKVYASLIFQIFIAFVVLMYAEKNNIQLTKFQYIGIFIGSILILFSLYIIESPIIKFIFLTIFSCLIGLTLSARVDMNNDQELEIVKKAFIATCFIFVYLVLFGFFAVFMGARISPVVSITLFFALLILIIVSFIFSITGNYDKYRKIFAGAIIFLFSIFIIYDTVEILDRNYFGDFITATVDYFLDFINLFSGLLEMQSD
jgi:FtsH-binding integral membrane protein